MEFAKIRKLYFPRIVKDREMACNCETHLEQYTCSGDNCNVCVLSEENFIENPQAPQERYCLNCAKKKAGFTDEELGQLMLANQKNDFGCGDKC
ncbi:MAG: hypothetical protein H8D31_05985 [Nitrosopumilus sp.]|nr:hypothetical protein [Nitrosopumilus sp.]